MPFKANRELPGAHYPVGYQRAVNRNIQPQEPFSRPSLVGSLRTCQRTNVLETLRSERFCDCFPAEVYATLLDKNEYLCSERTMYRILVAEGQAKERRDQLKHPEYTKRELLAIRPTKFTLLVEAA